jgi:hypothetical protein
VPALISFNAFAQVEVVSLTSERTQQKAIPLQIRARVFSVVHKLLPTRVSGAAYTRDEL